MSWVLLAHSLLLLPNNTVHAILSICHTPRVWVPDKSMLACNFQRANPNRQAPGSGLNQPACRQSALDKSQGPTSRWCRAEELHRNRRHLHHHV